MAKKKTVKKKIKRSVEVIPSTDLEGSKNASTPQGLQSSGETTRSVATADPLSVYLASIRKYPLLSKEEEHDLAMKYKETGDPQTAEILITSNLRFVVKVAAEYSKFGGRMIDLIQEGNVGLMQALKEFNPYKGVRLITYAVWWIRGHIQEYLMRQYSMVRIGTTQNQRKLFYKLQQEKKELEKMGEEPNLQLLSHHLGIPEKEIESMQQRLFQRDVSLNTPVGESSSTSMMDFQVDESSDDMDIQLGHQEELHLLREKIDELRPQLNEREIFLLDHRVLAEEPLKLQEIGNKYGITREAVRQVESRLLKKIKTLFEESLKTTDP